jgi:hypothetical protein
MVAGKRTQQNCYTKSPPPLTQIKNLGLRGLNPVHSSIYDYSITTMIERICFMKKMAAGSFKSSLSGGDGRSSVERGNCGDHEARQAGGETGPGRQRY